MENKLRNTNLNNKIHSGKVRDIQISLQTVEFNFLSSMLARKYAVCAYTYKNLREL